VDWYLQRIVYTIMSDFDPAKEAINLSKHRISLARWADLDDFAIVPDDRFDYGEHRYRAYGYIDGAAYCLVFTIRNERYRPISLRRAHAKEMRRYAPQSQGTRNR
jgi:uncharacterized DUF497 family protein